MLKSDTYRDVLMCRLSNQKQAHTLGESQSNKRFKLDQRWDELHSPRYAHVLYVVHVLCMLLIQKIYLTADYSSLLAEVHAL